MWDIPNMWEGGECWIIGGGPSIPLQFEVPEDVISAVLSGEQPLSSYSSYLSAIHDKHVIGINAAFLLGDWIDLVFFGDGGFYFQNIQELCKYPKMKVSCNPSLRNKPNVRSVKHLYRNGNHPHGISLKSGVVSWNGNSGAAAISLAAQLGVVKIYLLGFDMSLGENGKQHFHRHYPSGKNNVIRPAHKLPFSRHLQNFPAIAKDAKRFGIEIINLSPDSAIEVFPKMTVKEVLQ